MRTHVRGNKIHEALELLNEAAREKQEEIYDIFGNKYEHLKEILGDVAANGQELAGHARERIVKGLHEEEKMLKETVAHLDKKVHKDPWVFLSTVALGSLLLGVFLGHKR